jgi:hypothetical protein
MHIDGDPTPLHPEIKVKRTSSPKLVLEPVADRGVLYPPPTNDAGHDLDLVTAGSEFLDRLEGFLAEAGTSI